MTEEQLNGLRDFYTHKNFNAYEQCWKNLRILIIKRCRHLMSDSDFAEGLKIAYEDIYFFMNTLEKMFLVEKTEEPE